MPIPVPNLDSRDWSELVNQTRAMIPTWAPEWTDHNAHDPGITLSELFAWVAETLLFEVDQLSPALVRAFLRLVGVSPRHASVAEAVVAFRQPAHASAPLTLARGFQVEDDQQTIIFESQNPVTVSGAWLELSASEPSRRGVIFSRTAQGASDLTAANRAGIRPYLPLGDSPRVGDAMTIGLTEPPAVPGEMIDLYVWTRDAERRVAWDDVAREPTKPRRRGQVAVSRHYWARTQWEHQTSDTSWAPLDVIIDETRALTLSGRVRLTGPAVAWPRQADGRFWMRCRLAAGGYDCPPVLTQIAVNATTVRHEATYRDQRIGRSSGLAHEQFEFGIGPIVVDSTRIDVIGGDLADGRWTEVSEWDRSGPLDHHYLLDAEAGKITFGNGRKGRVPAAGSSVVARHYRVGGGRVGNVAAGTVTHLIGAGSLLAAVQPRTAVGGADAETPNRAHGRALNELTRPTRAVTTGDFEELAYATPSVEVARAIALPGFHPHFDCLDAAGVVTVVVLPACGAPPSPSRAMIDEVRRHLEPRRPLTTELYVVGPAYRRVSIHATLHVESDPPADLAQQARAALAAYFDPLTGGADGKGWPLGRDVLESEILALLNTDERVVYVDRVHIDSDGGSSCANLRLCPTELPAPDAHHITIERSGP